MKRFTYILLFLFSAAVLQAQNITLVSITSTPVTCGDYTDGSITIEVSGGSGNLNYTLFSGGTIVESSGFIPDRSYTFSDYPKSTDYAIFVADAVPSTLNLFVPASIEGPDPIKIIDATVTDIQCASVFDGTITVSASGEDGNLIYDLSGPVNDQNTTGFFENLQDGSYSVTVSHAICSSTDDTTGLIIEIPDPISILLVDKGDVTCFEGSDGFIEISVSGGTPFDTGDPYLYSWSSTDGYSSSEEDIFNIPASDYSVQVTDKNGCVASFGPETISQGTEITASVSSINMVSCYGAGDGSVSIAVAGGSPPRTYSWTGQITDSIYPVRNPSGLVPDIYDLHIEDKFGCSKDYTAFIEITEPDSLSASFVSTDVTCYQSDDGTISVTVTGGTEPYNYEWTLGGIPFSTSEDLTGLAPGTYSLDITDDNGCFKSYPNIVTITEPADIQVDSTSTNISCFGAADGTISVTSSGGTPGYAYSWTGPSGFTSTDSILTGLGPGKYYLTVTDANSCDKVVPPITLTEPTEIQVNFTGQTNLDCFGDSDGSITIDVTGGVPPYTFSWTNQSGTEVSVIKNPTGLPAGIYSLTVTDSTLCSVSFDDAVELTQPQLLTTTLTATDVVCPGGNNGTITVNPSGGTPPYEHSRFLAGPYQLSPLFPNLSSGTYKIYTRDVNGCKTNKSIVVDEPDPISYDYAVSGVNLCHDDSSVSISINNVSGGTAPYNYSIDGGATFQSGPLFTNIPGGTYPVVVRDVNLCQQAILPLTVLKPDSISIIYFDSDDVLTCYDAPEGYIAIEADGGTGSLTYALDGGSPEGLGEFTGILGGIHTITITDEHACQKDTTVELLRPAELIFTAIDLTDITSCQGDNTGEINAAATGGTGVLRYSLNGGPSQLSGLFQNLNAGDYIITVEDVMGCTIDSTVTLTEPDAIIIESSLASPAECNGTATGTVTVSASGGTPGYTYTLDPPVLPPNTDGNFSGLSAGDYTVSVTDANLCGPVNTAVLTVNEPSAIVTDTVIVNEISCNGAANGSIEIVISGGTPPYEYSIDNQSTYGSTSLFTDLIPGTYDVFARDANGCTLYIDSYILDQPDAIILNAVVTDVSPCFGDTSGAISATASGGWNEYEYSIDDLNYQASGIFSNLAAGDYTVFVRDTGNCSASIDVTINQPEAVTANVSKTDYEDVTLGTITISDAAGGTAPYEYSIDGPLGTFTAATVYTDLTAGTYEVVVRDANGCIYEETVIIYDILPLEVLLDSTNASCFGSDDGTIEFLPQNGFGVVQYSIDDGATYVTTALFENLPGDSTYLLRAYDEAGKEYTGSIYLAEPPELFIKSKNIIPANCNAFSPTGSINLTVNGGTGIRSFRWSDGSENEDLTGVVSGTYTVEITDEAGCAIYDTSKVSSWITLNTDAGRDTTICAGASLILDGMPGEVVLWEPSTYLSNTNISNPVAANITDSITYTYMVTETGSGYGCYNIDTLRINVLPMYGVEVPPDTTVIQGQVVQLYVNSAGTFDSYHWIPSTGLNASDIPDPEAILEASVSYVMLATNDFGCLETDTIHIEVVEDLHIYNAFSPNGDTENEYFEIDNAASFPDILVEVFNRWGSKVFSSIGYTDEKRWDGTFNGKPVPVGTYYYVIIPAPGDKPITGNVTIIR